MPIDASILLGAKAPALNPLETLSQTAGIAGQLNQNKLFQQEYGGKVALGRAAQAATSSDGVLDARKMLSGLAQDPSGAFLVPDAAAQAQAREKEQLGIDQSKVELFQRQIKAAADVLTPIIDTSPENIPNLTKDQVYKMAWPLVKNPDFKGSDAMGGLVQALDAAPAGGQELYDWAKRIILQGNPDVAGAQRVYGTPGVMDTVDKKIATMTSMAGNVTPKAVFNNGIAPADTIQRFNPVTKQMETVSKAAALGQPGAGPAVGVPSAPPIGEQAGADTAATGAATAYNEASAELKGSAERIFQLQQAGEALEEAQTGHGSAAIQKAKSLLTTLGFKGELEDNAAAYDRANKYLQQYANNSAGGLGAGTNDKLAATISATPNTHMTNLAAREVAKVQEGIERMRQAKVAQFEASGLSPSQFNRYSNKWNTDTDATAYVLDKIPPERAKAIIANMLALPKDDPNRVRFFNSVRDATAYGGLKLPGAK